jgi:hypothetical protein
MCTPHPKPLLQGRRSLVRHGTLDYFSPNTISRKPRYFFLFSDCLLLTKRTGTQKFWLKVYIHLGPNIHIIPMWDSPDFEFRLLIDEKVRIARSPLVALLAKCLFRSTLRFFLRRYTKLIALLDDTCRARWPRGSRGG